MFSGVDEQEGKLVIYPKKSRGAHYVVEKKSFFPMGDILYVKPVGKNCIYNCISAPKLTKGAAACAATPFASIGE